MKSQGPFLLKTDSFDRLDIRRLPADVLAYFPQMGAKGGRSGGKRSLETMMAAERTARAKKASLAAAARRAKSKRKRRSA